MCVKKVNRECVHNIPKLCVYLSAKSTDLIRVLLQGGMVVVLSVEFGGNALWEESKQAV